jgi:signal transduction histidine kinase
VQEQAALVQMQQAAADMHTLAGVLGMLDLLRLTPLTPEQAGFVRVMQGSAEGLMQVLNEILDFSRIQSGHLSLDLADFHIGELLDQVIETLLVIAKNLPLPKVLYTIRYHQSLIYHVADHFPFFSGSCIVSRSFG